MDDRNTPTPVFAPTTSPVSPQVPRHPLNVIFFNERGLRCGWRITVFLLQVLVLATAFNFLGRMLHLPKTVLPAMWQLTLQEAVSFLIVLLPAAAMARLESRPAGDYGLPARFIFGAKFWHGAALGIV